MSSGGLHSSYYLHRQRSLSEPSLVFCRSHITHHAAEPRSARRHFSIPARRVPFDRERDILRLTQQRAERIAAVIVLSVRLLHSPDSSFLPAVRECRAEAEPAVAAQQTPKTAVPRRRRQPLRRGTVLSLYGSCAASVLVISSVPNRRKASRSPRQSRPRR